MKLKPCHGLGETIVRAAMSCKEQIKNDIGIDMPNVANLFSICESKYCPQKDLLDKYSLNMSLIDTAKTVLASRDADFKEESIYFFSKRQRESSYLCEIVFQKPENEVYVVSAYLMETYLGCFVFRANWYFRKSSKQTAFSCFHKVVDKLKELKNEFLEDSVIQTFLPSKMRETLKDIEGEIEPKTNQVATFLNPKNIQNNVANIITVPSKRSITDDLIME